MAQYPEMQRSCSITVDLAFADACRTAAMNLFTEIGKFVRKYAERYGNTPDTAIVLAGTDLAAGLNIASHSRDRGYELWRYDNDLGRLYLAGSRVTALICEYPSLSSWDCQITAPGSITLGDALVHRATITAVRT